MKEVLVTEAVQAAGDDVAGAGDGGQLLEAGAAVAGLDAEELPLALGVEHGLDVALREDAQARGLGEARGDEGRDTRREFTGGLVGLERQHRDDEGLLLRLRGGDRRGRAG